MSTEAMMRGAERMASSDNMAAAAMVKLVGSILDIVRAKPPVDVGMRTDARMAADGWLGLGRELRALAALKVSCSADLRAPARPSWARGSSMENEVLGDLMSVLERSASDKRLARMPPCESPIKRFAHKTGSRY
jgi:hypothetical protein